jgi:alcohol dehydrogenase (cytochrome c)
LKKSQRRPRGLRSASGINSSTQIGRDGFSRESSSRKPVWDFQTGGDISANPISFNIDGKQHVAIAAGHAIFVFGL